MRFVYAILIALLIPLYTLPKFSTGKIDEHFLIRYNLMSKDELIDKTNLETMVIISEIEIKIAEKKKNEYFKDKPFKNVRKP